MTFSQFLPRLLIAWLRNAEIFCFLAKISRFLSDIVLRFMCIWELIYAGCPGRKAEKFRHGKYIYATAWKLRSWGFSSFQFIFHWLQYKLLVNCTYKITSRTFRSEQIRAIKTFLFSIHCLLYIRSIGARSKHFSFLSFWRSFYCSSSSSHISEEKLCKIHKGVFKNTSR